MNNSKGADLTKKRSPRESIALSDVQILKGIPVPKKQVRRGSGYERLIEQMEVGDCVQSPSGQALNFMRVASRTAQATADDSGSGLAPPKRFVSRALVDRTGWTGVWRVS